MKLEIVRGLNENLNCVRESGTLILTRVFLILVGMQYGENASE